MRVTAPVQLPALLANALPRANAAANGSASSAGASAVLPSAGPQQLPRTQAVQLSFDQIVALQQPSENAPSSLQAAAAPTPEELFLKEAHKSPMQRMRDQILGSLGLSEESLAQMSHEERAAVEEKIKRIIQEKIREASGVDKNAPTEASSAAGELSKLL